MIYVKVINGLIDKFPYNIGDLRKDNSNVSFPANVSNETLKLYGMYEVKEEAVPQYNYLTEILVQDSFPKLVNGTWTVGYSVVKKLDAEAEKNIRDERNRLLQETDWMALSDNVMTPEWAAYRAALRNLPQSPDFPWNVVWPSKPQ